MNARREWGWVALVWLAAMFVAFRGPVLSGFDLGFSDRGDGIIEISLLEHWRNVLTGHSVWNRRIYFHPHPGTLGIMTAISCTDWSIPSGGSGPIRSCPTR